ncbi:MAG: DUF1905 domain-containing protein [Alphaproteobacteria bacterium]|nr:DUF1905 domain-containing protein [Alphaproteobacteria bacterium]
MSDVAFSAPLWRWQGDSGGSWHFVTLPADMAVEIRLRSMTSRRGFGSVRVEARIGGSVFRTSLFPMKSADSYLLPVKASVRRDEDLGEGDIADVGLTLLDV